MYDAACRYGQFFTGTQSSDVFTYTIADPSGDTAQASVTVIIDDTNSPPSAVNDSGSTFVSQPSNVEASHGILANDVDPDGDALTITAIEGAPLSVGQPITLASGALLTVFADGSYRYEAASALQVVPGQPTADQFAYTIRDGPGGSATATVSITIQSGFAFDALTNQSTDRSAFERLRGGAGQSELLLSHAIESLAPEPILSGYAKPGTVLVGRLYAEDGSILGETTTSSNQAGNWVLHFFGVPQRNNTRVIIEHVATEEVALSSANFDLTAESYRSMQLTTLHSNALTAGSILADPPSLSLKRMHEDDLNPLRML